MEGEEGSEGKSIEIVFISSYNALVFHNMMVYFFYLLTNKQIRSNYGYTIYQHSSNKLAMPVTYK